MPLGMETGLSPGEYVFHGDPPLHKKGAGTHKFSAHVYYSYGFVRTLHSRYWFVQVQVLTSTLVLYAFYFLEKKFNRTQCVPI